MEKVENKVKNILTLKGKEINLSKLNIEFKLNDQQEECLNQLAQFLIDGVEPAFTLSGYPGSGKSSITKILFKWVEVYFGWSYDYTVTAPTHRAKYVIESLSGQKSKTIQSILGLIANVNVEKLDYRNIQFDTKRSAQIPNNLLVIDESSMINDVLFDLIIEKCSKVNCQVLFIGDKAQLKPVKQNHISKVFNVKNSYELTKVERQRDGNPIGSILLDIRHNIHSEDITLDFETKINNKNEGIFYTDKSTLFLDKALDGIKNVIMYQEYLHSRILCYSNDRVALYNKLIRGKFGFTDEFNKGEILMAYDNVSEDRNKEGIVNSCDYVIENDPKLSSRYICSIKVFGYEVDLVSTDERTRVSQFLLSKINNDKDSLDKLAFEIEELRQSALLAKKREDKSASWRQYFETMGSFLVPESLTTDGRVIKSKSIDYAYAMTAHKSQGGTFKDVYVDYRDISKYFDYEYSDIELRNQLLYVAMSRCTNQVILFH